jgi:ABC-type multidrug transport system ATPase subunit
MFLNILAKIFGIEHTLNTRVGNEVSPLSTLTQFIRGVSGGEKKRVSIAETMVTRGAIGCWDNSTRGLDASTALEYCRSLRVLTNLAKVSTIVTIYQAGEGLYEVVSQLH